MAAVVGLVVFGVGATPAHAETVRSRQWHLTTLHAEEIWQRSTGKGVTIALIDTGVKAVPELSGRLVPGSDFPGAGTAGRKDGGTTTAAVIAGTGKGPGGVQSAFGLAPGAKIMPLNISDGYTGKGSLADQEKAVDAGLAPALRYAADSDAKIISVSVTLPVIAHDTSPEVRDAVAYAMSKNKLVFAGVGYASYLDDPGVDTPASLPGVVGVTAIDSKLTRLKGTGVGRTVDIAAPGTEIISACAGGTGLCRTKGTEVASALAAASAALVWSVHPDWTRNQVLRVLLNTISGPSDGAVRNDSIGYGAVRPLRALKTPGDPGPRDEYPLDDYAEPNPTPTPTPISTPTPSAGAPAPAPSASAGTPDLAAAPGTDGHSTGFWIALGVCAAGLLCLAVGTPLLVTDHRRGRTA
ncbi:S8 family serine peptidase [Streptomyces roseicoloratus]|uniref:S8 family serine peptidase n=1 Tax=Streptomyces roseicoloratus TaxID=2508722 RepID=A0ABY9RX95_9ACTN|nr:S8 family serine peptidase [Streptomyces roseicoloratus]WMX46794.1 S8 family serine peptidase [Streptomyces roseicoloratus]